MRITAVETIHLRRGITVHAGPIQWLWVRIHTDSGLVGLGETYPHPEAEKAVVLRSLAPVLLGRDPSQIDRLWADMLQAVSFSGWAGAEMRAISAVDIALWDLAGKVANLPRLPVARRRVARVDSHLQHLLRPHRFSDRARAAGGRAGEIRNPRHEDLAVRSGGQGNRRPIHHGRPDCGGGSSPCG